MEITRHFTATTFIVYQNKVLLHLHKKLGIWIPVGGHIDRDELPEETAIREIKEETGLDVELFWHDKAKRISNKAGEQAVKILNRPVHILLEDINLYHQHIDFIYYAKAYSNKLNPEEGETKNLKWLTIEDIQNMDIQNNEKVLAKEALYLLNDSKLTY